MLKPAVFLFALLLSGGAAAQTKATDNLSVYYAKDYGNCDWTTTGDVGPCVNLAIAAATATGGGKVVIPRGDYGLSTTIVQTGDADGKAVMIEGAGGQGGGLRCNTLITWRGAAGGTMVNFDPGVTKKQIWNPGLRGVCLRGAPPPQTVGTGANIGLRMIGVQKPLIEDIYVTNTQTDGIFIDANQSSPGGSGRGVIRDSMVQVGGAANDQAAHCLTMGMTVDATVYPNDTFGFVMSNIWCNHKNGHGFNIGAADNNYCYGCTADTLPGGTGKSLIFRTPVSNSFNARDNLFQGAFGSGGGEHLGQVTCEADTFNNTIFYVIGGGQFGPAVTGNGTCTAISTRGEYWSNAVGNGMTTGRVQVGGALEIGPGAFGKTTAGQLGHVVMQNNTPFKILKTDGTVQNVLQMNTANQTLLLGSSGGLIMYDNQAASEIGRSDGNGNWTFGESVVMKNANLLMGKDSGGTNRNMLQYSAANKVILDGGTSGLTLRDGNGTIMMTSDGAGNAAWQGGFALKIFTVATLPTCGGGQHGLLAAVSDALAPTYHGALAGGGGVRVPVYCDGLGWKTH